MKKYLVPIISLLPLLSLAQRREILQDSVTVTLRAALDFQNDRATLLGLSPQTAIVKDFNIRLAAGDVIIEYALDRKEGGHYTMQLVDVINEISGNAFALKPENVYGDIGTKISLGKDPQKQIILANTAGNDNVKWLNGEVTIRLHMEHYQLVDQRGNPYDCNFPPELHWKEFSPEFIFGGIGAGTLIVGLILDENSDKIYEDYRNQTNKQDADPIYDNANAKHQDALVTKAVGIAFITGAAISAAVRWNKYRQAKKYYNLYCTGSVQPFYDTGTSFAAPNGQVGLSLKITF